MFKKIIVAFSPMIAVYGFENSLNMAFGDICQRIHGLDIPFHILGGFVTAITGLLLYRIARERDPKVSITPRWLYYVSIISFVALVGILWEHYEFLHDFFFHSHMQPSNADTMKDLMNDLIGAILFCVILARYKKTKPIRPGEY